MSRLSALGIAAYGIGVMARWRYILEVHHPRNNVDTDDIQLTRLAELLIDARGHQEHIHTIWPPGMASFLALNFVFDPTAATAAICQFVASIVVPLLIARTAQLAYGERAGWVALAMASLHVGFIHYGGLFLAEGMFTLAVTVAVWTTVSALVSTSARVPVSTARLVVQGLASGLAWGLAFSLRPNALPVALFAGSWLAVRWLRQRRWRVWPGLGAGALGLLLVFVPLSHRCTVLVGHFCPGASNGAMNVALGHAPAFAGLRFKPLPDDPRADVDTTWIPPAKYFHGVTGVGEVEGTIYESEPSIAWVEHQLRHAPNQFVVDSIGNMFDLFGIPYWPDDYAPINKRRVIVAKQAFLFFVLIPGMAMWGLSVRRMIKRRRTTDIDSFLVAGVTGVLLLAAATMGEARYRMPFDALFIILAARVIALRASFPADAKRPSPLRGAPTATALVLAASAALVVLIAHPSFTLAARLAEVFGDHHRPPRAVAARMTLSQLSSPRPEGTPWDAPGTFRFSARPFSPELQIDLEGERHSSTIEASVDHNDRYECTFYRHGTNVGKVEWGIVDNGGGMHVVQSPVPRTATAAGYDMIAVRPLYGDGAYALGHLRLF